MTASKKMMDKKFAGMIMALLVIVILFIPAYASYEIDQRTVSNVMAVEGLYTNGTVIYTDAVDKTHVQSMWWPQDIGGSDPNNDTIYIKLQGKYYINYTDFMVYVGSGEYTITPNYTIHGLPATYRQILVPMNVTTTELAEFDFIRVTTNSEHGFHDLIWKDGSYSQQWVSLDAVRNDTYMTINTISLKSAMLSSPDERIYLSFSSLDTTDVAFTFKMEGFNLEDEHTFFWQEEHLWYGSVAVSLVILSVCALFTTQYIDIKLDKVKDGRRKRG